MGQEIDKTTFEHSDFKNFYQNLQRETELLQNLIDNNLISQKQPVAGFEIEAWLVDESMRPAAKNVEFLATLNDPLASTELAKFNIELNNQPVRLHQSALTQLHNELDSICRRAHDTAESMGLHLIMIGTLPTLRQSDLNLSIMSDMNRYRALNRQILEARGAPIHLEICGIENLNVHHHDVMLESAATSFQIHLQSPLNSAHHFYNASIIASAPCIAASANAPMLFGKNLWAETRIPLFEQSIEIGGYHDAAHGPLRRVSFGSDYARKSIMECFTENLDHFPVLLPVQFNSSEDSLDYLRLHNGTIWRWNRPLVGFDDDGTPHIRIEQRVIPAGPTLPDMIANAAFFYGIVGYLHGQFGDQVPSLPFHIAKDNFYKSARYGLDASVTWLDQEKYNVKDLMLDHLIPQALDGLTNLGLKSTEAEYYLSIMQGRMENGQTGAQWQRSYLQKCGGDFTGLMHVYFANQWSGRPVHEWSSC